MASRHARTACIRLVGGFALGLAVACGSGGGGGPLPGGSVDVTVDANAIVDSIGFSDETFAPEHCAVVEGATLAGTRLLLRFDTIIVNVGDRALVVGDPVDPVPPLTASDFAFSPCHGHFHFTDWAEYSLVDSLGTPVALGHKQAFCLVDSLRYELFAFGPVYVDCDFQGISPGWGDLYARDLDGQWVDVTGVPEGDYTLVVAVNVAGKIVEDDVAPNVVEVPVHVPDPALPLP
jgi:hypothetical protein